MSGDATIGPGRAARPVADAPIEGLLARTDDLAKRWLLELAGAHPLAEIAMLPFAQIVRVAPSLCADVLRALRSDDALAPHDQRGEDAGAYLADALRLDWDEDPREAVAAVEALRAVLWSALVHAAAAERLGAPSDALLRDLADRLSYVCSIVLARSLSPDVLPPVYEPAARPEPVVPRNPPPWSAPAFPGEPTVHRGSPAVAGGEQAVRRAEAEGLRAPGAPPEAADARQDSAAARRDHAAAPREPAAERRDEDAPRARTARSRAVLVDEFVPPPDDARGAARVRGARAGDSPRETPRARARGVRTRGRALPWDIPLGDGREIPERDGPRGSRADPAYGAPAPAPDVPEISVLRRRQPRERE